MWGLITKHKNIAVERFVCMSWSERATTSKNRGENKTCDGFFSYCVTVLHLSKMWAKLSVLWAEPNWTERPLYKKEEMYSKLGCAIWSRFNSSYPARCFCIVSHSFFPLLFLSSLSCGSHEGIVLLWESLPVHFRKKTVDFLLSHFCRSWYLSLSAPGPADFSCLHPASLSEIIKHYSWAASLQSGERQKICTFTAVE